MEAHAKSIESAALEWLETPSAAGGSASALLGGVCGEQSPAQVAAAAMAAAVAAAVTPSPSARGPSQFASEYTAVLANDIATAAASASASFAATLDAVDAAAAAAAAQMAGIGASAGIPADFLGESAQKEARTGTSAYSHPQTQSPLALSDFLLLSSSFCGTADASCTECFAPCPLPRLVTPQASALGSFEIIDSATPGARPAPSTPTAAATASSTSRSGGEPVPLKNPLETPSRTPTPGEQQAPPPAPPPSPPRPQPPEIVPAKPREAPVSVAEWRGMLDAEGRIRDMVRGPPLTTSPLSFRCRRPRAPRVTTAGPTLRCSP